MTTIYEKEITCSVCGKKSEHVGIGSTNTFGPPDLDTRPPEMERSTIHAWVQRCPHCGYCASTIADDSHIAHSIINSREYQSQLEFPDHPELANSFLCKAMIEKEDGALSQSAWSAIHAAWACDDSGDRNSAKKCRVKAVELIKLATSNGEKLTDQEGAEVAITVDLLRRSEQFDEASHFIDNKHHEIREDIIRDIMKFEKELICRSDILCHTISEVLGEKQDDQTRL